MEETLFHRVSVMSVKEFIEDGDTHTKVKRLACRVVLDSRGFSAPLV
jgi:hypothetical protein